MNYIYKLNTSTFISEDGISRTAYGIEAYKNGDGEATRIVSDIFTDRSEAERFIRACNLLALDIDHLDDVIYDIINA